jgi:hypothetical protein
MLNLRAPRAISAQTWLHRRETVAYFAPYTALMRVFIFLLLILSAASGCSTSLWEREYAGHRVTEPKPAPDAPVRLREVPWDRVDAAMQALRTKLAASDKHFDEWPADQKNNAKASLLTALQISEPADSITVLGRSDFRTTTPLKPNDGELEAFARKLGATTVVYSSTYLGKADRIVHEWMMGSGGWWDDPWHRDSSYLSSEMRTTSVPIRIQSDELAWRVFYLREAH